MGLDHHTRRRASTRPHLYAVDDRARVGLGSRSNAVTRDGAGSAQGSPGFVAVERGPGLEPVDAEWLQRDVDHSEPVRFFRGLVYGLACTVLILLACALFVLALAAALARGGSPLPPITCPAADDCAVNP